jgi:hypothetical protein
MKITKKNESDMIRELDAYFEEKVSNSKKRQ